MTFPRQVIPLRTSARAGQASLGGSHVHREDQDRRRHRQQRRQRPRRDRRRRNRRGLLRPQGRVVQRLAGGECADLRRLHQQGCSHPGAGPRRPRRDAERNERVFTATFTLDDTTKVKGRCGSLLSDQGLGLLAVCDDDDKCRDAKFWDKPVDCEAAGCPQVTITFDPAECVNQTRGISLSLVANPFSTGLQADVDFGDGTVGTVDFVSMDLGGGIVIGSGTAAHNYSVPGSGQASFHVTVTIAGRPECVTTIDIPLDRCPASTPPPPPGRCPVERITLRVFDASGADVTARLEDGACLPPGRYVVRAEIVPAGATTPSPGRWGAWPPRSDNAASSPSTARASPSS